MSHPCKYLWFWLWYFYFLFQLFFFFFIYCYDGGCRILHKLYATVILWYDLLSFDYFDESGGVSVGTFETDPKLELVNRQRRMSFERRNLYWKQIKRGWSSNWKLQLPFHLLDLCLPTQLHFKIRCPCSPVTACTQCGTICLSLCVILLVIMNSGHLLPRCCCCLLFFFSFSNQQFSFCTRRLWSNHRQVDPRCSSDNPRDSHQWSYRQCSGGEIPNKKRKKNHNFNFQKKKKAKVSLW